MMNNNGRPPDMPSPGFRLQHSPPEVDEAHRRASLGGRVQPHLRVRTVPEMPEGEKEWERDECRKDFITPLVKRGHRRRLLDESRRSPSPPPRTVVSEASAPDTEAAGKLPSCETATISSTEAVGPPRSVPETLQADCIDQELDKVIKRLSELYTGKDKMTMRQRALHESLLRRVSDERYRCHMAVQEALLRQKEAELSLARCKLQNQKLAAKMEKMESEACKIGSTGLSGSAGEAMTNMAVPIVQETPAPFRPSASWSSVVRGRGGFPPLRPSVPAIFVRSTNADATHEATMAALKSHVTPSDIKVRVVSTTRVRDGGILVRVASKEEATRMTGAIPPEAGIKAELATQKLPKVIIFGLPQNTDPVALMENIAANTEEATGMRATDITKSCRLSHKTGPRTGNCHYVVALPPAVRSALVTRGAFLWGWESFRVRDYVDAPKCNRCHLYGHLSKTCKAQQTCARCSQPHDRAECRIPDAEAFCATCFTFNKKKETHTTGSEFCPARIAAVRRAMINTKFSWLN
jgi:hypothetical protein